MRRKDADLRKTILYGAIVALCFLYTGSAYMSQFYRLMGSCDGNLLDIITSGLNYALQAFGILLFCICLKARPRIAGDRRAFIAVLFVGIPFMLVMQLAGSKTLIIGAGCVFHVLIGVYFGFYLTLFAAHVPADHAAVTYGAAYAFGSVGTYVLSLFGDGGFLASKGVSFIYLLLAAAVIVLVYRGGSVLSGDGTVSDEDRLETSIRLPAAIVVVMMIISVTGSGLYYSLPQAENIDWNLIRAFYAVGLIVTGAVMDYRRWMGEILAAASLLYPLIAFALIGEGMNNTAALAFSYLFRGCLTVYYVISFTDIASSDRNRLYVAPLGLLISRITEAIMTLFLMKFPLPNLIQILVMAFLMIPLIVLVVIRQKRQPKAAAGPISEQKRIALYAEKHGLTAREAEILNLLSEGLTDDEISARIGISRNTVRFHVSNILKKSHAASRVEAVRSLQKFS